MTKDFTDVGHIGSKGEPKLRTPDSSRPLLNTEYC